MKKSWEVTIIVILAIFLITGLKCQQEVKKEQPVVTQKVKRIRFILVGMIGY
jgi:PBP1b-binding outer membrane lipoprotein LpoB